MSANPVNSGDSFVPLIIVAFCTALIRTYQDRAGVDLGADGRHTLVARLGEMYSSVAVMGNRTPFNVPLFERLARAVRDVFGPGGFSPDLDFEAGAEVIASTLSAFRGAFTERMTSWLPGHTIPSVDWFLSDGTTSWQLERALRAWTDAITNPAHVAVRGRRFLVCPHCPFEIEETFENYSDLKDHMERIHLVYEEGDPKAKSMDEKVLGRLTAGALTKALVEARKEYQKMADRLAAAVAARPLIEPGCTPDVRLPEGRSIEDIDAEKVEKLSAKKLASLVSAERRAVRDYAAALEGVEYDSDADYDDEDMDME